MNPKQGVDRSIQSEELSVWDFYKTIYQFLSIGFFLRLFWNLGATAILFTSGNEIRYKNIFDGLPLFLGVYLFFFFSIRILDLFRLHFRFEKSSFSWEGAPKHILLISFLPLFTTSLFWFLPSPILLGLIVLGTAHCFWNAVQLLQFYHHWGREDFIRFLLLFFVFCMIYGFVLISLLKLFTGF